MKRLLKQFLLINIALGIILTPMTIYAAERENDTEIVFTDLDNVVVYIPSSLTLDYDGSKLYKESSIKVSGIKTRTKEYNVSVSTNTALTFTNETSDKLEGTVALGTEGVETWNADEVLSATEKTMSITVLPPYEKEGNYTATETFSVEIEQIEPDYSDYFTYTVDTQSSTATITGLTDLGKTWVASNSGLLYIPRSLSIDNNSMSATRNSKTKFNVTAIGDAAFQDDTSITSVYMEEDESNLTSIGTNSFSGLTNATSINIANTVTTINEGAFEDCTGLTEINIPLSVITVKQNAFNNDNALVSVIYEGTEEDKNLISISSGNDKFINATWVYNNGIVMTSMHLTPMSMCLTPMTILDGSVIKELAFSTSIVIDNEQAIYSVETIELLGTIPAKSVVNVVGYVIKNDEELDWVVIETTEGLAYMNVSLDCLGIKTYSVSELETSVEALIFEDTTTYNQPEGKEYNVLAANTVIEIVGKVLLNGEETDWIVLSDTSCLNARLDDLCTDIYEVVEIEPIEKVSTEEILVYNYPDREELGVVKDNLTVIGTVTLNKEENVEWLYIQKGDIQGYIHKSLSDLADPINEEGIENFESANTDSENDNTESENDNTESENDETINTTTNPEEPMNQTLPTETIVLNTPTVSEKTTENEDTEPNTEGD